MPDDDKKNVIPFAWRGGVIKPADLGPPTDLRKTAARELIDAIEAQGFEGEAGPLENSTQWIEIKRRLTQP